MEASQYHLKEVMKRRQCNLKSNQKKRALSRSSERANKRHRRGQFEDMESNSPSHHTDLCTTEKAEGDHCHTFPLGESDQDSDQVTNPGYTGNLDNLQSPKTCSWNSDIAGESQPSYLGFCAPLSTTTEISSSSPTVNSNVNPPFASQQEERRLCGGEEPTQTPRNASNKYNMEQEEMETEIMWKLRANRVKQILSSSNKEFHTFYKSKRVGLEFNVGFGPKQHISVDSLSNAVLLEVAKFALAMNSSQQDFIMEILEYNFDLGLQSQHQRDLFICEIMKRVRKLRSCEDAVKFSKEVFQIPGSMSSKINMANQSVVGVDPELSSELRMEECDVSPSDSHAENKQLLSQKMVALYPFCKKIGLKLHVNKSQLNKKLDITKLTNGAMTEVMNFAEQLCGTFEQICLDILTHNLDLDFQSGDSDFARYIFARIPAVVEQKNLLNCKSLDRKIKGTGTDSSTMVELDCQNNPNLDASSAGSLEAAIIDQYVDTLADIEQQDEHNLMLWKLRANHIEHILSVPHEEHCPFYSYSRCKKLGIDFNVGSGVKQNLDPKLLTNGIMVELNTFATALVSSQKYFITDILEYNFHLDFKSELHHSAFALQTWDKIVAARRNKKFGVPRMKMCFELPDLSCIEESTSYCPRCYQVRNDKLHQDESDPGLMHHPHSQTMTDTVPADANCTAQKPANDLSSTLSAAVETIIDRYPRCKQIGLNLCVDKNQPKEKVDLHLLTNGIINDIDNFTRKLCGRKLKIINDVLEHNFKIGMQRRDVDPASMFQAVAKKNDGSHAWFNKVYVIQPCPQRQPRHASKVKQATSMRRSELKEVLEKRKLALKNKKKPTAQEEMETESNYTCPLGESDLDLDDITVSVGDDQTQTVVPNEWDMEQEEMGTESNLWKLRANRVKQILSSPITEFGQFTWSKKAGLEFNVGFGPKKNISFDSLPSPVLPEVAKFTLAMNSSQQDFIMEILEYNFDFGLQGQHQRDLFTCEIMKRARQLRSCEDAVKFSKEVFQLPGPLPSINAKNQSVGNVNILLSSESRMEECGIAPSCPRSSDETKEHISEKVVVDYPFCKEIGLILHVNQSQPNKKLDITKLTNGAMTEVTNFAEKLCGTFEQICLDILRHNLDFDSQSGDSDLARDILARIPAVLEQRNLASYVKAEKYKKIKRSKKRSPEKAKLDYQDNQNLDACSASSSQPAIIYQNVGNSSDIEHQNQLHLKLWKLRANHIQQILSIPHGEHCPFYSYSRCRKLGIDFNVGSGVKQNLDPKFLTNGIMVELINFATALQSAKKYFITEILEYNFHLDFISELNRSAFAQQTVDKIRVTGNKRRIARMNMQFELPDTRCMPDVYFYRTTYCPKCYRDRNHRLCQDQSDPGHVGHPHPHTMLHTVSADGNCTEQKPPKDLSTVFSTLGKTVMEDYPLCKKIGLNLFVDKDQPKDKLDTHVLTHRIIYEVASFAKVLCGTIKKIIHDILEHNFNINMQGRAVFPSQILRSITSDDNEEVWFNEVFVIPPCAHRQHGHATKVDEAFAMQRNEMKETVNKRKLALQTKKERATLPSQRISVLKPRGNPWIQTSRYPICMEIGLDLDVTSKPGKKKKLDLKLLTKAVMLEIYKFAVKRTHHYLPQSLYDILDYNFDLRSQHHRRWEFTMATAFEVKRLVKQFRKKQDGADEVFKLPFVFAPKSSSKPKERGRFGGEEQAQTPGNVQSKCDMEQEEMGTEITYIIPLEESDLDSDIGNEYDIEQEESGTENGFTCPLGESDLDSDIGDDCGMEQEGNGTEQNYTFPVGKSDLDPHETHRLGNCTPFLIPTIVPSTLPAVNLNVNPPFVCLPDKRGLCEGKEQTQTSRNVPNKCDMEQEDIGAESLWKLRANCVKQILSECGPFYWCKKVGLEFNVGFGPVQNISVDSLHNSLLIEVAKFALAMNSSQQHFIMEILEYNFDFYFQSKSQRNTVTCEIMETVRQLKDSQDADKGPGEVFDLPHSITAQDQEVLSVSSINPELRSLCRTEECDVAPICHLRLHAETKEHTSLTILDPYPFCKEIGLKLHVNQHQQNKKLDIKKLTNGAMTEVTNFAEKLCGTFDQICLDILRHNLDLDFQSGDYDLARDILAQIPAVLEQRNLARCVKVMHSFIDANVDACSAGSSQTAARDKNVGSSPDLIRVKPFKCAPKKRPNKKPRKYSQENPNKKTNEGRFVLQVRYHLVSDRVHFLNRFKNKEKPWSYDEDTEFSTDPGMNVQMNGSLVSVACGSPLQENIQKKEEEFDPHYGNMKPEPDTDMIVPMSGSLVSEAYGSPFQENIKIKEEKNDPHYGNMKQEPGTEEKYHPQYDDVKTELDTEGAEHSVPGEPTEPLGYTKVILWPNSERPPTDVENQYVQYYILTDTQGSALCPNTEEHKN